MNFFKLPKSIKEKKESPERVLDQIKKRVGEFKQYVDDKVCNSFESFDKSREELKKYIQDIEKDMDRIKSDFSQLVSRSKDFFDVSSTNTTDIQKMISSKDEFSDFKTEFLHTKKEILDQMQKNKEDRLVKNSSFDAEIKNINSRFSDFQKSLIEIKDSIKGCSSQISHFRSVLQEDAEKISKSNAEIVDLKNSFSSLNNSVVNLGQELFVKSKSLEKRFLNLEERNKYLSEELEKTKNSFSELPTKKDFSDLNKKVSELLEKRESSSVSSDWKHQFELKISRLEKKINK
jgi:chromosome segregation ATPase